MSKPIPKSKERRTEMKERYLMLADTAKKFKNLELEKKMRLAAKRCEEEK